jgi:predicted NBD/HSP70 family sugar kinase
MTVKIGLDIGGTKTEIIALNGQNGKELFRKRIPTDKTSYEKTIQDIRNLVEEAESIIGEPGSVGIGMTGFIDPQSGLAKNSSATWLNDNPFQRDINDALRRTVRIENDANCFAVSEAIDGAGKGFSVVYGVIIGTGFGGGLVVNKRIISGRNRITGQIGHNPLPYTKRIARKSNDKKFDLFGYPETRDIEYTLNDESWREHPGEACYCGKRGCLETWVSGTGLKMDYHRVEKEELSTHDIIANFRDGEPKATAAFERYVDRLARGLSLIVNIVDPDVFVFGGGMSNVEEIYERIPQIWTKYTDSTNIQTLLKRPRFGDSSGVRGAAWLWPEEEHQQALPKAA